MSAPVRKSLIYQAKVLFFCLKVEIPFLGKFGPKKQNCQFKLELGT